MTDGPQKLHRWLAEWIPEGASLYGPTRGPRRPQETWRWRIDFADGGVCRVSFVLSEVESMHGRAGICSSIRKKRLIQGRPDTYRIYANGGVVPNPRGDWG